MTIKSILVNFDAGGFSPALLSLTVDLAERFQAEIVGFAGAEPSAASFTAFDGRVGTAELLAQERAAIERSLYTIEERFKAGIPGGISSRWRGALVHPNRGLAGIARNADLIIVGSALGREADARGVDIGDLLLKAGRPVLYAGTDGRNVHGDRILVGWKDTREARRAISDALPFLLRASDVFVAMVEERDYGSEWDSLKDVLHWLGLHGVRSRGEIVPMSHSPAETLTSLATQMGADLIVTGAYGHARLREWLFGGVTADLLGASTLHRFMAC